MSAATQDIFLVPQDFPTIRAAIAAIVRPSTIMLSPGIYAEDLLLANIPALTISSSDFIRRGVVLTGAAADSVVTVENTSVYLSGIEIRSHRRARAIAASDSSLALQECVLAGNRVAGLSAEGAALRCVGSSVRLQKSMIAGNLLEGAERSNGGGLHLVNCKVEIAGSSIQANEIYGPQARGAGIYCEQSRVRLWRSRVTENAVFGTNVEGAGMYLACAYAQIGGSVITGNSAAGGRGSGIFIGGPPEDVVIHKNTIVRRNYPDDLAIQ